MLLNLLLIIFLLLCTILVNACMFACLLQGSVRWKESLRLYCGAAALNKLLFTGSGYMLMSWRLKGAGMPWAQAVAACVTLEIFLTLPWIVLGVYFGAAIGVQSPLFLLLAIVIALYLLYRRKKAAAFLADARIYIRQMRASLVLLLGLALLSSVLLCGYYMILFRSFHLDIPIAQILKIVSVAFTLGYFSPVPSGLGVREGGFAVLLAGLGVSLERSISIALVDRCITSGIYVILGFAVAAKIIGEGLRQHKAKQDFP